VYVRFGGEYPETCRSNATRRWILSLQFKTLKYRPEFPSRFTCIEHARFFCVPFFNWYNEEHHHSGIGFLTPEALHYGRAGEVTATRQAALQAAYADHPERFNRPPQAPDIPKAAWINRPSTPFETGGSR